MTSIDIYTDGSCKGNPGPGGWAFAAVQDEKVIHEASAGDPDTTNNRMEMRAIQHALEWAHENNYDEIHIYSDSKLLVNTLNNGWKKKKNTDIWADIERILIKLNTKKKTFNWVKGHANNKFNEHVDQLAVAAAPETKPRSAKQEGGAEFFCKKCNTDVEPKLIHNKKAGMVKAVCSKCNAYLKFVSPTQENIKKAN